MSQRGIMVLVWALVGVAVANGADNYSTPGGVYSQSFNSLSNSNAGTGMVPWIHNIAIAGAFAYRSMPQPAGSHVIGRDGGTWNSVTEYRVSGGAGGGTGNLYSFGELNATERALGSVASNSTGDLTYGIVLKNATGIQLTNFQLSYVGEQWGSVLALIPQSLQFDFAVFPADPTVAQLSGGNTAGYTRVPSLDFVALHWTNGPVNLNGNLPENRVALTNGPAGSILSWPSNYYLVLRWFDDDDDPPDHALALDELSFVSTGQPAPCEPADANCDLVVNGRDVSAFVAVQLGQAGCSACAADMDSDSVVGVSDIEPFVMALLAD